MNKVAIQYDALEDIINRVLQLQDTAANHQSQVRRMVDMVEGGAWVGRGADAFRDELTDLMQPGVDRLEQALEALAKGLRTAHQRFSEVERQGAGLFNGDIDGAASSQGGGTSVGGGASPAVDYYSTEPTVDGQRTGDPNANILFINGINTDGAGHLDGLRQISQMYGGQPVSGIFNQSNPRFGMVGDLFQAVDDWAESWTGMRFVDNPAVNSAMDWIRENPDGQLVVHSQGAAVTSAALMNLRREGFDLSNLNVRVLGGAGPVFPSGPTYEFFETDTDPVPVLTRVLNNPLQFLLAERAPRNVLDHDFNIFNPIEGHGIDVYRELIGQMRGAPVNIDTSGRGSGNGGGGGGGGGW